MVVPVKKIPEKENFQDNQDNEKLDCDYYPYLFPPRRHVSEAIIIKADNSIKHGA
jgi:hypothetical protein